MDHVHVIRHKVLVEGQSIRRVQREMRVSRNTVRKYLTQPEPVRQPGPPRRRPVFERVRARIDALLADWAGRTTAKQRVTATRVHRALVEEGYRVGVTTVRDYLRERRRQAAEVFVPLVHRPGDEGQIDFFQVTVEVDGRRQEVWKFVMRLMYAPRDFAWLYERADQLALLDGHVRAFAHFGAVPHRLLYDNLSAAVRKVLLPKRVLAPRFQALVSHYLFEPCFARPGQGHDKGGVEARGKAIRLQHLTPIPRGASLEQISQRLLAELDRQAAHARDREGQSALERFAKERAVMLPLPARPFEVRKVVPCSVSRSALVKVEGAVYSVPSPWKLLEATAYVGVEDVRLVCRGQVEVHRRQRFGGKAVRYRHYLPELSRKPQALRQVAPELLAELGEPYAGLWRRWVDRHGPREAARVFARVLGVVCEQGETAVARVLATSPGADGVELLALARRERPPAAVAVPETLAHYSVESGCAADYDALLPGGRHG